MLTADGRALRPLGCARHFFPRVSIATQCLPIDRSPGLIKWIEWKAEEHTSPEIQNELLSILASGVSRGIARDIQEDGISPSMSD